MVTHNLEFGYNGYKLPPKARAPRSLRKSGVIEKKIPEEDDEMCGFNLLATIAENLLLESRNSNSLCSSREPVNVGEDKCLVQNSVENEFEIDEIPLNLVSFSKDNPCKELPISIDDFKCGVSSGEKLESNLTGSDSCQIKKFGEESKLGLAGDAVVLDAKSDVVVSIGSKSSIEVPVHGSRDGVNLVSRDDDENLLGFIRPCMTKTLTRPVPRNGDRRIRKILASRHRKGGSRNADAKPWYYPIKKRRYFDHNFDLLSDYRLRGKAHKGNRTISSMKSLRNASFVSRDHHVRLQIKSFRVPEFFIEIPETATVGSLKCVVVEAVTRKLSDGLQVGLMIQGKKVQDDNKTLLQTGISQENTHIHSLGFSLESNSEISYSPENAASHLQTCDDSGALNPVSAAVESSPKARTVFVPQPRSHKSKSTERQQQQLAAHRRIRRPFSVSEVEALVHAVEQLGTGRWRDVKLRAFEDTDHRTYVDLKDKWKTLVHTARIPPQQRRGEALPEDVLDRVLKAHAYWSQQSL